MQAVVILRSEPKAYALFAALSGRDEFFNMANRPAGQPLCGRGEWSLSILPIIRAALRAHVGIL
jgi:hypothetical protein